MDLTIADLLNRNRELTPNHTPWPTVSEIVTCADPRCTPERILGLGPLEAVCFRNVCGHVAPQLPDIVGLDQMVDFKEIMIIHHTDCGALYFNDAAFRETLEARAPDQTELIERISFGTITDVKQSVLDDMAILKASPLVRQGLKDVVRGFVYDIGTGLLSEVFP